MYQILFHRLVNSPHSATLTEIAILWVFFQWEKMTLFSMRCRLVRELRTEPWKYSKNHSFSNEISQMQKGFLHFRQLFYFLRHSGEHSTFLKLRHSTFICFSYLKFMQDMFARLFASIVNVTFSVKFVLRWQLNNCSKEKVQYKNGWVWGPSTPHFKPQINMKLLILAVVLVALTEAKPSQNRVNLNRAFAEESSSSSGFGTTMCYNYLHILQEILS